MGTSPCESKVGLFQKNLIAPSPSPRRISGRGQQSREEGWQGPCSHAAGQCWPVLPDIPSLAGVCLCRRCQNTHPAIVTQAPSASVNRKAMGPRGSQSCEAGIGGHCSSWGPLGLTQSVWNNGCSLDPGVHGTVGMGCTQRPRLLPVSPLLPEPLLRPLFLSCPVFLPLIGSGWVLWCLGCWGSFGVQPGSHPPSCLPPSFLPAKLSPASPSLPALEQQTSKAQALPAQQSLQCGRPAAPSGSGTSVLVPLPPPPLPPDSLQRVERGEEAGRIQA